MNNVKINLKCSDWLENVHNTYNNLLESDRFTDVTLVTDDKKLIQAHKLILSAGSEYFRDVLSENPHSHPMLCLDGVSSDHLHWVIKYLYVGEVSVPQSRLQKFLQIANKYKCFGLDEVKPQGSQTEESEDRAHESVYVKADPETTNEISTDDINDLMAGDLPNEDPSVSVQKLSTLQVEKPEDVDWYFLKTGKSGKSKGPGVLITHGENYKFQNSGFTDRKTQKSLTYVCSEKARTNCNAKAHVSVAAVRSEVEGEPDTEEYSLIDVDPPEAHRHFHGQIRPQILADKIATRMINMMKANPFESAIKIRDLVMGEDFHTLLLEDQRLVENCLPAKPENTLNKIKKHMQLLR